MVVSEGLACQNMFLSIFLLSFFPIPAPPSFFFFFLPKWEGAKGSGYLGCLAFKRGSWRLCGGDQ